MKTCPFLLALASIAALAAAPLARAQEAPAGNAHPERSLIDEGSLPNPFAAPGETVPPRATPAQKRDFARAVELAPLRDLAVFHNGRVKILDTLARESVRFIAGRSDFIDYIETSEGGVAKVHHDPLFTLLDTMIEPRYYDDKPVVHVEFLPLRRAMVEAVVEDPQQRERWLTITRLSPRIVAQSFPALAQERGAEAAFGEALQRVQGQMSLLARGYLNLEMIAPTSPSVRWLHVSSPNAPAAVRDAFADLGVAWRARDAAGANDAIERIAALLPTINADLYPGAVRRVEALYNATQPFDIGAWLYGVSFLLLTLAFGTGRRWLIAAGVGALGLATLLHASGFAARWLVAERLPIQNQFESMTGLSLAASIVGLAIMAKTKQWLFGAAAAGAGFLVLLVATTTAIPGETIGREAAILNTSVLLKYHVTSVLASYGLITLGFILSAFYLLTHYTSRARGARAATLAAQGLNLPRAESSASSASASSDASDSAPGAGRVLHDLDKAQTTILQLAFWILGVGVLLGAWWADHSWGRWWAFDPKETWALITWIVYLIVVHVRFTATRSRGLITAWLSVLGFFVMLWTYFGVNLLLPGLHAYA